MLVASLLHRRSHRLLLTHTNAAITSVQELQLDKPHAHQTEEVIEIPFVDVREHVLDGLVGPKVHARITRRYQKLPVSVSVEMPKQFYISVFNNLECLVDQKQINEVFGAWSTKPLSEVLTQSFMAPLRSPPLQTSSPGRH